MLKSKTCPRCGEINPVTNRVCRRCFFPLTEDAEKILEMEARREIIDEIMETLWSDEEFRRFFLMKVRKLREEKTLSFISLKEI